MRLAPLCGTDLQGLREVFAEEVELWLNDLHWDYRPSLELVQKYAAEKQLPGFALCAPDGRSVGYSYYIIGEPVGFIGNLYVEKSHSSPGHYRLLLERVVQSLIADPRLQRIESQIVPFNADVAPLFEELGFQTRRRSYRVLDLHTVGRAKRGEDLGFRALRWNRSLFEAAAEIIYDSYKNSPDQDLCFDYQSVAGCSRFLRNIIDNPGCGSFRPEMSWLALDQESQLCAVLMTSLISPGTGMIPQISVRRDRQGGGIGSGLLRLYFEEARRKGLERIALSVSKANQDAERLYSKLGFQKRKSFYAFVWKR